MRFITNLLFISSIITAIHGLVIFKPWEGATAPLIGSITSFVQWFQTSYGGVYPTSPSNLGDKVATDLFWDQSKAEKSADDRGDYYMLRWNDPTSEWLVDLKTGKLPEDESFTVDHVFDIQMLTMWMNSRNLEASYFGRSIDDVRNLLNGSRNMAWIPTDLYCAKCSAIASIMESVLASGKCNNVKAGSGLTVYVQGSTKDVKDVLPGIQSIIGGINKKDADDFGRTMTTAFGCLVGSGRF